MKIGPTPFNQRKLKYESSSSNSYINTTRFPTFLHTPVPNPSVVPLYRGLLLQRPALLFHSTNSEACGAMTKKQYCRRRRSDSSKSGNCSEGGKLEQRKCSISQANMYRFGQGQQHHAHADAAATEFPAADTQQHLVPTIHVGVGESEEGLSCLVCRVP